MIRELRTCAVLQIGLNSLIASEREHFMTCVASAVLHQCSVGADALDSLIFTPAAHKRLDAVSPVCLCVCLTLGLSSSVRSAKREHPDAPAPAALYA